MENSEIQNEAVTSEESSPSSESASSSQTQTGNAESTTASPAPKEAPFHEHPRFKELVEQKNQYQKQLQEHAQMVQNMQRQMAEMQKSASARQEQAKPTYDQVLKRLEGIDPEFAQLQAQLAKDALSVPELRQQLEGFKEWQQRVELETVATKAESRLNQLYTENKVPDALKSMYRAKVENLAYSKNGASLDDLDNFFRQAHDELSKFFSDYDRNKTASYIADKKKDKTPVTQTGGTAASTKPAQKGMSLDEKIKFVAEEMRRGKQAV